MLDAAGLKNSEIAKKINKSENAMNQIKVRARKKMTELGISVVMVKKKKVQFGMFNAIQLAKEAGLK